MTSSYIRFAESIILRGWKEVHHPDYNPNPKIEQISKLFPQYFVVYKRGIFASPTGQKILERKNNIADPCQTIAEVEAEKETAKQH